MHLFALSPALACHLALQPARRHAGDEATLKQQEQGDDGQDRNDAGGAGQFPVVAELVLKREQTDRHRLQALTVNEGVGEEELVLGAERGDQADHDKARPRQRQNDGQEHPKFARAVHPRRVLQFRGQ